jgi:cobalt-zinc-cadmium efflux system protein
MAHSHGHDELEGLSDRRIAYTVALNVLLTVAEIIGGVVSGSVALVADALHNLNDAVALLIALFARRIARRQPDEQRTFGYRRAEVIGGLISLVALAVVGLFLAYESILRFFEPSDVGGWTMIVVAGIALAVDVLTVVLLYAMRKGSVNIRAAFAHNISDALASVAVILGGVAILLFQVTWVDPLLSLLIVGYIVYQVAQLLPGTVRLLMESAPEGLDIDNLVRQMQEIDGVEDVHHLHVWQLDEHENALEAHVVIARENAQEMDRIKDAVKYLLKNDFAVTHPMLELEFATTADGPEHDTDVIPAH